MTGSFEYRLFFGHCSKGVEVVPDAAGQWRDSSGTVIRGHARLVANLAESGDGSLRHTEEIAERVRGRTGNPCCAPVGRLGPNSSDHGLMLS